MQQNELEQVLRHYPSPCRGRLVPIAASTLGFSGARIWRIETDAEVYCLRAMPSQTVDTVRLAGLHRLLAHTFHVGIRQIAVPLFTVNGASFVHTDHWVWQLEPWMPGRADFREHPNTERLCSAMECLAEWHLAAATFAPVQGERPWFAVQERGGESAVDDRQQRLVYWDKTTCQTARGLLASLDWPEFNELGQTLLDLVARQSAGCLLALRLAQQSFVPVQPCLRDVWHDHLLFTGDDLTGLIDAHSCRSDSVAVDLARLLGSLLPNEPERWKVALNAYQRVRPLSPNERMLVEVFDRSGTLLSGLSWLKWCCLEGRVFADQGRVVARLTEIVRRLEAFDPPSGTVLVWE